ncbi:MAG: hypothetical protein ACKOTZ_08270 [Chloroflexota bacterium]
MPARRAGAGRGRAASTRRALLLVALAAAGATAAIGTPGAAHTGGRSAHALPPVADPGALVVVGGSSLWSDAEVAIVLERPGARPVALATALTAGDGTLAARVRLPDGLPGGAWTLVIRHPSGETAEAPLGVRDGPIPLVALGAAALVALGLLALALLRRVRAASGPPGGGQRQSGKRARRTAAAVPSTSASSRQR